MGTDDLDELIISALRGRAAPTPESLTDGVIARWVRVPSTLGEAYVAFTDTGVQFVRTARGIDGHDDRFAQLYRERFGRPLRPAATPPSGVRRALNGERSRRLEFDLTALTEFERAVLDATRRIPAGQTRPYSWVAHEIGRPGAVRAVGSALARNPVPLLIPCHRVVRADGRSGEYIFGAREKEALLRRENVNLDEVAELASKGVHYIASDTTGVVCFPTCRDARRIIPAHRHGFRTLHSALAAGYRPCRTCRPSTSAA